MRLVLASLSPRRRELLKKIDGIEFEVRPSNIDENAVIADSPQQLTMQLAENKARAVFRAGEIVLAADTIVAIGQKILTKPMTEDEAIEMLLSLSGIKHDVFTGICVLSDDKIVRSYEKSVVEFVKFDKDQILQYVKSGKSFDKAGGYGIQDEEIKRITKSVEGSLTNIIGLPLELLEKILGESF